MFLCHSPHKIAFVAVPKTGTRTIYKILKDHFNGKLMGEHMQIIPGKCRSYYSFIIKRNPYDRTCSTYWALCRRNGDRYHYKEQFKRKGVENTLENFLIHIDNFNLSIRMHLPPQYNWYIHNNISKIIEFNHLEEEFNNLPFVKEKIKLPVINHTTRKHIPTPEKPVGHPIRPHWEEMITSKEGKLINKIYGKDFEYLGYEMRKY